MGKNAKSKAKFICYYLLNTGEICGRRSTRPEGCRSHFKAKMRRPCSACRRPTKLVKPTGRVDLNMFASSGRTLRALPTHTYSPISNTHSSSLYSSSCLFSLATYVVYYWEAISNLGFAHIPAIIPSRRMRIHRRRPKGLCLLILILLYRTRIRHCSAPPHACSLLLPMWYAIGRQFVYHFLRTCSTLLRRLRKHYVRPRGET
ncbi:3198_t:CDS:2 [Rhizophagus irregularis]|nr:3198_t:CDS:2 [Rhizophagus irregularis]